MKIFILFLTIAMLFQPYIASGMSLDELKNSVNLSCTNYMVLGPCPRPDPPYVGVLIRYWEPVLLGETVKEPGDTIIENFAPFLKEAMASAGKTLSVDPPGNLPKLTSGSVTEDISGSSLQFNDVHIYKFPFKFPDLLKLGSTCPDTPISATTPLYLSEFDAAEWRIGLLESLSPKSLVSAALGPVCSIVSQGTADMCMGTWGPTYPRRGFLTHQSEVVGSAADVYRAISISSAADKSPHFKLSPALFIPDPNLDKLQLVYPHPSGCFKIGENPLFFESNKKSPTGKYLWIYWRHRECCVL